MRKSWCENEAHCCRDFAVFPTSCFMQPGGGRRGGRGARLIATIANRADKCYRCKESVTRERTDWDRAQRYMCARMIKKLLQRALIATKITRENEMEWMQYPPAGSRTHVRVRTSDRARATGGARSIALQSSPLRYRTLMVRFRLEIKPLLLLLLLLLL